MTEIPFDEDGEIKTERTCANCAGPIIHVKDTGFVCGPTCIALPDDKEEWGKLNCDKWKRRTETA